MTSINTTNSHTVSNFSSALHRQLSRAVLKGDISATQTAIDSGASVNQQTKEGLTMLHFAVGKGHIKAVKLLILVGADPSLKEEKGTSALDFAKILGHKEIVQILETANQTTDKIKAISETIRNALCETVPKSNPIIPHTKKPNWATPFGSIGGDTSTILPRIMAQYAFSAEKEESKKNSSCIIS